LISAGKKDFYQSETRWVRPGEVVSRFEQSAKGNGGERNQTLAAVIANHPFTNAFVEAFSQSHLRETMSDQPIAAPTHLSLAPPVPAGKNMTMWGRAKRKKENGRSDRIRTCDVLLPKQVL
jgi:hypothetical protein